jgi:hypothetical protein
MIIHSRPFIRVHPDSVLKLIARRDQGFTYRELAKEFGTSHMTCFNTASAGVPMSSSCELKRSFATGDCDPRQTNGGASIITLSRPSLPADVDWVLKLIARRDQGLTYRELAEEFGTSHMTFFNIVKRWEPHVEQLQAEVEALASQVRRTPSRQTRRKSRRSASAS